MAKSKSTTPSRRGGYRPGAGRPKGVRNRATVAQRLSLQELVRSHTETAVRTLAEIAKKGESESARVAAATALLDRGYGEPRQAHEISGPDGGPVPTLDLTSLTDEQLDALERIFGPFTIEAVPLTIEGS